MQGDAVDVQRKMVGLRADRLDQRSPLAVDHVRQAICLLLHIAHDFVGLAGDGRAECATGGKNRPFDVGRGRLDLGAGFVGCSHQRALCGECAGLDLVGGVGGHRAERPFDFAGDCLDLVGGVGGGRLQRSLRVSCAVQDRSGGIRAYRG